jgi:hypothetical protein
MGRRGKDRAPGFQEPPGRSQVGPKAEAGKAPLAGRTCRRTAVRPFLVPVSPKLRRQTKQSPLPVEGAKARG